MSAPPWSSGLDKEDRKLGKAEREKSRRSEQIRQFERLRQLIGVTGSKAHKLITLVQAIKVVNDLFQENTALEQQIECMRRSSKRDMSKRWHAKGGRGAVRDLVKKSTVTRTVDLTGKTSETSEKFSLHEDCLVHNMQQSDLLSGCTDTVAAVDDPNLDAARFNRFVRTAEIDPLTRRMDTDFAFHGPVYDDVDMFFADVDIDANYGHR